MSSSDPSVVIESINTYRHWLDAAGLLVAVGLIGEYRKNLWKLVQSVKSRNWKKSKLLFLLVLFPVLVVIGVAAEFWINFQESALENTWEISQLPRNLTKSQRYDVAGKVQKFPGTKFDLEMQQDIEPLILMTEIEDAVLLARWVEVEPRPERPTFDRGGGPIPMVGTGRTVAVVWVLWPTGNSSLGDAAKALAGALRDNGIASPAKEILHPDAYDSNKVHIWVGTRPIPYDDTDDKISAAKPKPHRYPKAAPPPDLP